MSLSQKLRDLFNKKNHEDEDFFDALTDTLILGDIRSKLSMALVDRLKTDCKENKIKMDDKKAIQDRLAALLKTYPKEYTLPLDPSKNNIWLLLGVNGAGKTTTAAKLGKLFKAQCPNITFAAADTFRAAAVEQLLLHAKTLELECVANKTGGDPAAVIFDAADKCFSRGGGLVIVDTAGRLHNKENLMNELKKLDRVCEKKASSGCYKRLLVIDSTTGTNSFNQAQTFGEAIPLDCAILTKFDSGSKGGAAINIGESLNLPVAYCCNGEGYDDIKKFDVNQYVTQFLFG